MPKSIDAAYWAGIIDADGWITMGRSNKKTRKNPTYTILMAIDQKNPLLINEIRDFFGVGSVTSYKWRHYDMWRFLVSSNKAAKCLRIILPYLKLKKDRASLALEFHENKSDCRGTGISDEEGLMRKKYFQEMKRLNA